MTTIEILEWMIKEYEKRGGGYSQIEALKEAISALSKSSVVSEFELAKAISEYYVKEGIPKAAKKCCFVAKIVHNLITKGEPR